MALPANMDATWVNPATVQYNAQELRRADSTMFNGDASAFGVRGGVVRHGDTSLAVSVSAADVVTVQPGAVVIPGNSGAGNGCYRTALGAADTGALTARNATNPRITLVVFRVLDTDVVAANPGYTGRIEFIDGVAAASPATPALPLLAVELARITVPATGGGNATVDMSNVTYAAALGARLAVPSASKLPAADSKWDQAVALDTGIEYTWNGTAWITPAADIPWTALATTGNISGSISYCKQSGIVHVEMSGSKSATAGAILGTLPATCRPTVQVIRPSVQSAGTISGVYVDTAGNIRSDFGAGAFGGFSFPTI